ncbi:MAG: radical SAM protein [Acidobacteriota bacterium]|nr:radical SAM protein [Acidobacteriota bacterium]
MFDDTKLGLGNNVSGNFLALTPVPLREASWYFDEKTGRVVILVYPKRLILGKAQSMIWKHVDGFNTVNDIASILHHDMDINVIRAAFKEFEYKNIARMKDIKNSFWGDISDNNKKIDIIEDPMGSDTGADLILIVPPQSIRCFSLGAISLAPPLGLMYIASNLILNGYKVKILDLSDKTKLSKDSFHDYLDKNRPKAVGITCWSEFMENALELAKTTKEYNPEIAVILGGPHVTFMADECFKENDYVDVVCRHEGEYSMIELMDFYKWKKGSLQDILGITYREQKTGSVVRNRSRAFIKELDELPFPARHLIDFSKYTKPMFMITSRGCTGKCKFCAGTTMGRRYRFRHPDKVAQEIEEIIRDYKPEEIYIVDDAFTIIPDRAKEICAYLKNSDIRWFCESRVDAVNEELLRIFYESGCRYIQFGIESGSQQILDAIKKETTLTEVENAVKCATEAGIKVACSFIIGHFDDTDETIQETIALMKYLKDKYNVALFCGPNVIFPGTYQYAHRESLGLDFQLKSWSANIMGHTVTPTKYLSYEKLRRYVFEAIELCMPTVIDLAKEKNRELYGSEWPDRLGR